MSAVNKNLTDLYSCTSFTGVQSGYYKGGTGNEYGFVLAGTQMTVAISTTYKRPLRNGRGRLGPRPVRRITERT